MSAAKSETASETAVQWAAGRLDGVADGSRTMSRRIRTATFSPDHQAEW